MIFFKNMGRKYVDMFWSDGQVALKPLRAFASTGDVREDPVEGLRGLQLNPKGTIETRSGELFLPGNIEIRTTGGRPAPILFERGSRINIQEVLPEGYAFCVSEARLLTFGDGAYKIYDAEAFAQLLRGAVERKGVKVSQSAFGRVEYGRRKDVVRETSDFNEINLALKSEITMDDFFRKPSALAFQLEWRFVFLLYEGQTAQPQLLVDDKALINVCSPVEDEPS
jgi:hypothetical protein